MFNYFELLIERGLTIVSSTILISNSTIATTTASSVALITSIALLTTKENFSKLKIGFTNIRFCINV